MPALSMPELAMPLQAAIAPPPHGVRTAPAAGSTTPATGTEFLDQLGHSISTLQPTTAAAPKSALPNPALASPQAGPSQATAAQATLVPALTADRAAPGSTNGPPPSPAPLLDTPPSSLAVASPGQHSAAAAGAAAKGRSSRLDHTRVDTDLASAPLVPTPVLPESSILGAPLPSAPVSSVGNAALTNAAAPAQAPPAQTTPLPSASAGSLLSPPLAISTASDPLAGPLSRATGSRQNPTGDRRVKQTSDSSTDAPATVQANAIAAANLNAVMVAPANATPAQTSTEASQPAALLPPLPPGAAQIGNTSPSAKRSAAAGNAAPLDSASSRQDKLEPPAPVGPASPAPADAATAAPSASSTQSVANGLAPALAQAATTATSQVSHPATPASAPPPAVQVGQAVADPVRVILAAPPQQTGGPHITTIQLQPADLGRVEIRIERSDNGPAKIELAVERPDTLLRLVHDQPQLQHTLDQAGIPQQGRTITFSLASNNGMSGGSSAGFAGGGPSGGSGQRSQRGSASAHALAADIDERGPPMPIWSRIGLNITA